MKTGPENKIKAKVRDLLKQHGVFNFPVAASPYGYAGISDRLCCLPNGKFMAIECKAPGKKVTALQEEFLEKVKNNGGITAVISGDESLVWLEMFLKERRYA